MARLRMAGGLGIGAMTLAAVLCVVGPASADLVTLNDLNSTVEIDTSGVSAGVYSWLVDSAEQLSDQSFWYRVGDAGGEANIGTLTQSAIKINNANLNAGNEQLLVLYTGAGFTVTVNLTLTGGAAGSLTSDLLEVIAIANTSGEPLDFHFFQYADFDLDGTADLDAAEISGGNTARQNEGGVIAESVDAPTPSHYEVGLVTDTPNILDRLLDGNPTTLGDLAGPVNGDAAWAFQWDRLIPVGGTLIISKDKHISETEFVPEPATMGLLALGGLSLLAAAIRPRRRPR